MSGRAEAVWDPRGRPVTAWVEQAVGPGARVRAVRAMRSSSTEKHLFEIERSDGRIVRAVLRRYPDVDRLAGDPWYEPANEAAALRILEPTPVPAPRLLALDDTGIACGAPALLESLVPGTAAWVLDDLEAYLVSAAERLVSIHAVAAAAASHLPAYAPYFADDPGPVRPVPRWTSRGSMWERVFSLFGSSWPAARVRFIHRDYHPGNALWDGSGGGVVDWATAARGPAGIDLARMRQNLAAHHGTGAADRFSLRYARGRRRPDRPAPRATAMATSSGSRPTSPRCSRSFDALTASQVAWAVGRELPGRSLCSAS